MSAALVVVGFSSLFSQLGVGPALVQRPNLTAAHVRVGLTSSLLLSLLLGGTIALIAPLMASFFGFDELTAILRVLAFGFPLQGLSTVARSLMQRDMRFRTLASVDVLSYLIGYAVLATVLGSLAFGVWALVFGHLAQSLISTTALLIAEHHILKPGYNAEALKELLAFGGGFTLARVFNYTASEADNIVAGRLLGATALGLYSRAFRLVVAPVNQLNFVIDQVLFPSMARIQSEHERLLAAFRRGVTLMSVIFVPISVSLAVFSREVVLVFLGSQWLGAVEPLRVLAVGMLFRSGYQVSDTLARATGAVYRRAVRQFIFAAAVVTGSWIGQGWGLVGLAWGVLAALVVNFYLMTHLSLSLTGLKWGDFFRAYAPALWVGSVALSVGLASASGLRNADLSPAIILLSGTGMIGLVVVLFIRIFPQRMGTDRAWMAAIIRQMADRRLHLRRSKRGSASADEGSDHHGDPS